VENEQNLSCDSTTRRVIASAIDEDCLILEEPDTGYKIPWPLNKIPKPFELGHSLDLVLQSSAGDSSFSTAQSFPGSAEAVQVDKQEVLPDSKNDANDEQMRQMLEKLVN